MFKYKQMSVLTQNTAALLTFLISIKGIKYATDITWRDLRVNTIVSGLTSSPFSIIMLLLGKEHVERLLSRPQIIQTSSASLLAKKKSCFFFLTDTVCFLLRITRFNFLAEDDFVKIWCGKTPGEWVHVSAVKVCSWSIVIISSVIHYFPWRWGSLGHAAAKEFRWWNLQEFKRSKRKQSLLPPRENSLHSTAQASVMF